MASDSLQRGVRRSTLRKLREIEQQVSPIVATCRQSGWDVAIDPTGGTKCMSAALALVARLWACDFRYVGGTQRGKEGLGTVQAGHEEVLISQNPLDVLGYQLAEEAVMLAGRYHFEAAARLLARGLEVGRDDEVHKDLLALKDLLDMFASWERFNHRHVAGIMRGSHRKHSSPSQSRLRLDFDLRINHRGAIGAGIVLVATAPPPVRCGARYRNGADPVLAGLGAREGPFAVLARAVNWELNAPLISSPYDTISRFSSGWTDVCSAADESDVHIRGRCKNC